MVAVYLFRNHEEEGRHLHAHNERPSVLACKGYEGSRSETRERG